MKGAEFMSKVDAKIQKTRERVAEGVAKKNLPEATRKQVDIDRLRQGFIESDTTKRAVFDYLFTQPGVEAAYRQLRPDSALAK